MISQIHQVIPKFIADELLRLARINRDWVEYVPLPNEAYRANANVPSWLSKTWASGADAFAMWAGSIWLLDGPKIFRPTPEQCDALEQIEVRLQLHEYAQPYPALLIDLPDDKYTPFESVLCHHSERLLSCVLNSEGHAHDITTTIAVDGRDIEVSLQKYDDTCADVDVKVSAKALRVAVNSCLALVNFGSHASLLLPKEVERDRTLAGERSERGERARERLRLAPKLVAFDREVVLHRQTGHQTRGTGQGGEKGFHWRRGHWAMQAHGPGKSLRKRILRKPVMVRADKLIVDASETSTVYKT